MASDHGCTPPARQIGLRSTGSRRRGTLAGAATLALVIGATTATTAAATPAAAANRSPVSAAAYDATAASQIAALQRIKRSLNPTERKLDSRLAVTARLTRDRTAAAAAPRLDTGVAKSTDGRTDVDIRVTAVTDGLLRRLRSAGAVVIYASVRGATVRAAVPVTALERVASWSDVRGVHVPARAMTAHAQQPGAQPAAQPGRQPGGQSGGETKEQRAARVQTQLRAALAAAAQAGERTGTSAAVTQGSVVSEGDRAEAANVARARTGVTGVGVKVCVLSDGVDSLAASQATGDLPAVDVLPGQAGTGDEGTAMLEIVHDLAPGAKLGFATAFTSDASFADNIRALWTVERCRIIVDDVLYTNEDPFQDGPIAQAVNFVTRYGTLYFSSAGNEGNTLDGTSGNYEGNFVGSGRAVRKFRGTAADFDPGPAVQIYEPVSDAGYGGAVTLFWADPLGHARDDYDLYNLDADGNVVAMSQDVQDGTQDPTEILQLSAATGNRLAVVRFAGRSRYFQLTSFGGRYVDDGAVKAFVTPGVTRGHSAAVKAFSVAAAPADTALPFDLEPGDPANPTGPYPNPFTAAQHPERFTSDGPRRMFFNADGTPHRQVRQKPDLTAADGVSTSLADFTPFFGTSAAAPHAAAIAALVVSGNPGIHTAAVRQAFNATALDLAPAGVDTRTGHGLIRADRVLAYTGATPEALLRAGSPHVTPTTGDGDAYLEPGETGSLTLPIVNIGDGSATGVSVTVASGDSRATITPHARSYGTIAHAATASRDFTIALAAGFPLGKRVSLRIRITFAGALSPVTITVSLATGQPAATATTFAYSGASVPIPDDDPAGVSVPIEVSGIGYAAAITFSIDGSACTPAEGATTVGVDHTFVRDLVGSLTAPDGRSAQLFDRVGGSGNNLCQVVFDDRAGHTLGTATSPQAPFTGSWRPVDPLSTLIGGSTSGTWTFHVSDMAVGDTGSIRAVSLHLTGFVPA